MLKFTPDHEWLNIDGDVATVGITDHAQSQLGDLVFVELPAQGRKIDKGAAAAVVESVKAASDVYAPISGEIVEVNRSVVDNPALVNTQPMGEGWLFKMTIANRAELDALLAESEYKAQLG